MNPIYSFMDEYEREMVVASRELEIAITEAVVSTADVTNRLRINMALSELKVIGENGTAEDLAALIMEAGNEAAAQHQGIISKVFSAIAKFFQSVASGISDFFSKEGKATCAELAKQKKTVTVDAELNNIVKGLETAAPTLEAASKGTNIAKIFGVIAGVGTLGAGVAALIRFQNNNNKPHADGETAKTVEMDPNVALSLMDKIKNLGSRLAGVFTKAGKAAESDQTPSAEKPTPQQEQNVERNQTPSVKRNQAANAMGDGSGSGKAGDTNSMSWKSEVGDSFIGIYEAGEQSNQADLGKRWNTTIQKAISWVSDHLKKALEAAKIKLGGTNAGQVAADTVKGAVNGAANAVADATKPEKKGLFGKKFIGDEEDDESEEMEESAGFDIDPIEAMLSSLAFGGYSG